MEKFFATKFEDIQHEKSLILSLSKTDPDRLKQDKNTDLEANVITNLALEELH